MGAAERRPAPRLAGFITATNRWPDKSSYFILPSFTSAPLHPSIPPSRPCSSSPSSLDSPLRTAALAQFFFFLYLRPDTHRLSTLFSYFLQWRFSSSHLLRHSTFCSLSPPPPPLCSVMNLQTEANNCTSAQVLVFVFFPLRLKAVTDRRRASPCFSSAPHRGHPSLPLSFLSSHKGYVK